LRRGVALWVVLSAAGAALYKRAQHVAETEQRSVGEVLQELPGRLSQDLRTLPDDLRAAAREGRHAAERRSAEIEEDYRQAANPDHE
jgi:hypothetical protein